MTTQTLKPCPFCGNTAPVIRSNGIGDYYVYCDDDEEVGGCGAHTSDRRAEQKSIAAKRWNQRTGN
ncbi:Lar family restriction alleviation protein [Magnetospirillum sp. XM-1]|uniref:Lar family restriction alleviation protein n=1 Tax=Magnetospirillum sp. XM-1 TaxID=1663591 RepID=UPI000837E12A|nr:Lar family restriction alleviation protein [Magnetospirillum sp. XM-1]